MNPRRRRHNRMRRKRRTEWKAICSLMDDWVPFERYEATYREPVLWVPARVWGGYQSPSLRIPLKLP
jgi:hypothetical protein